MFSDSQLDSDRLTYLNNLLVQRCNEQDDAQLRERFLRLMSLHDTFKCDIASNSAWVLTQYEPKLFQFCGTRSENYLHDLFVFVMPLTWLAFVVGALITSHWILLVGIPFSWLGMVVRKLSQMLGKAWILAVPFVMSSLAVLLLIRQNIIAWIVLGFVVTYLAEHLSRQLVHEVIRARLFQSPALFALLIQSNAANVFRINSYIPMYEDASE